MRYFTTGICGALLLMAMMVHTGCKNKSQNKPAQKALPEELAKQYREDAARLTLREITTTTQTGERGADLPQDRIDYFYNLLSKIYWMSQESDSIPDISHIHTFPHPDLHKVLVVLEKDAPFKENWAHGRTMTSNLYLNQLVSKYKLRIRNYREGALGPTLILESPDNINTTELAFLLVNIDGIRHAEAEGVPGDGNNIEYGSDGKNHVALKYSVGEGDCPSGCINRKYWIFYISQDGSIQYMGTRGKLSDRAGED